MSARLAAELAPILARLRKLTPPHSDQRKMEARSAWPWNFALDAVERAAREAPEPEPSEATARCRDLLRQAWDSCDHLARFEAWADLYYRRFGRLCPGKSDLLADSSSDENRAQCDAWHQSGLAAHDAIMEVVRLLAAVERLERDAIERGEHLQPPAPADEKKRDG